MIRIHFVNHACVVLENEFNKLVFDPWLSGTVFERSWRHLGVTSSEHLSGVSHVIYTHGHPDHYSHRDLISTPDLIRGKILLPNTMRAEHEHCQRQGLLSKVLYSDSYYQLKGGSSLAYTRYRGPDSWWHINSQGTSIVNLNDCFPRHHSDLLSIKRKVGRIDILMMQFTYASWVGLPEQRDLRARIRGYRLEMLRKTAVFLRSKYVIPIANHIHFCHEENSYLNDFLANPLDVQKYMQEAEAVPQVVVMSPGDSWEVGEPVATVEAVEHYRSMREVLSSDSINYTSRLERCTQVDMKELLSLFRDISCGSSASVYLSDYDFFVSFGSSGAKILENAPCTGEAEDYVSLSSEMLAFCLTRPGIGAETVRIGGRMRATSHQAFHRFRSMLDQLAEGSQK